MNPAILITGATGCVGRAVVSQGEWICFGHERNRDITQPNLGLSPAEAKDLAGRVEVIVHAAADTRFNAPRETLHRTNVIGTRNLLEFASRCARLRKFVHVSTTCVAGKRMGHIPEAPLAASGFVNSYEQTKHEAEQLVLESDLPTQVIRLATVLGSERDGTTPRWGAAHLTLYFLHRGLIAMVPGSSGASLDFISSELASKVLTAAALDPVVQHKVLNVSSREGAPLAEFVDFAVEEFARRAPAHRRFVKPPIVDEVTFRMFQESVRVSRDLLFNQVLGCTESFLPALLYPKTYATNHARPFMGEVTPWRELAGAVIDHCLATDWRRPI